MGLDVERLMHPGRIFNFRIKLMHREAEGGREALGAGFCSGSAVLPVTGKDGYSRKDHHCIWSS